jgi:hypothetical protein
MKRCHLYLLLGMLLMLPTVTLYAQTLPCTPNEVTAGFAQAAQADTLETWATSYAESDCPANIKNGASAMAAAYFAMSADMIPFANPSDPSALNPVFGWQPGVPSGIAMIWRFIQASYPSLRMLGLTHRSQCSFIPFRAIFR